MTEPPTKRAKVEERRQMKKSHSNLAHSNLAHSNLAGVGWGGVGCSWFFVARWPHVNVQNPIVFVIFHPIGPHVSQGAP